MEQLICGYCNKNLHNPIVLSCCGKTICETDLNELYVDPIKKDSIRCPFDGEVIPIPKNGFIVNKDIIRMLNNEDYAEAKKNMDLLSNEVNEYEVLVKNPEDYIYDYFSDIQNKIDLRVELIKHEIDKHHEDLTKKITDLRDKCKIESRYLQAEANNNYKREAEILSQDLNILPADKDKGIKTNKQIEIQLNKIKKEIFELKSKLIDNNEIEVKDSKINVIQLVGELIITKKDITKRKLKLKKTLEEHSDWVSCLSVLPNGDLASGSYDATIKIWDTDKGQLKNTLRGHSDAIFSLTVLYNEDLASGSNDTTIKIWDAVNGRLKNSLEGHSAAVTSLALLQNGDLASGSEDVTIKIWDTVNGQLKNTLNGHSNYVRCLTVLPNGDLASGSADATIKIWDTVIGQLKNSLEAHSFDVSCLTWLPNGDLASGSADATIKIWDTINGTLKYTLEEHSDWVCCLSVLPNGDLASGSHDKTIKIWDTVNGTLKYSLEEHSAWVDCISVLPNGDLASSWFKTIKIWD